MAGGLEIAIPALLGGLNAAAAGGSLTTVIVGVAIGAGVGALGLILQDGKKPGTRRSVDDLTVSTAVRNSVVPVLFGRGRMSGNFVALGGFGGVKDRLEGSRNRRLRICHAVMSLCEGPVQACGNYHLDGRTMIRARKAEDFARNAPGWRIMHLPGTADEVAHPFVTDAGSRFPANTLVHRRTAKLLVHTVVGDQPRLPDVNCDVFGPDLTVTDVRPTQAHAVEADVVPTTVTSFGYDAHAEAFWYAGTFAGRAAASGLVILPRDGSPGTHVAPPTGVASVTRGWYLGRHDVVCLQDPADPATFYLGHADSQPADEAWEAVRPDPSLYATPISHHHLDELNGILHTYHPNVGGPGGTFARWWLLTGRVERVASRLNGAPSKMIYSPDLDAYVCWHAGAKIVLVNPRDGTHQAESTSAVDAAGGLAVSGSCAVAIGEDGQVQYWSASVGAEPPAVVVGGAGAGGGLAVPGRPRRARVRLQHVDRARHDVGGDGLRELPRLDRRAPGGRVGWGRRASASSVGSTTRPGRSSRRCRPRRTSAAGGVTGVRGRSSARLRRPQLPGPLVARGGDVGDARQAGGPDVRAVGGRDETPRTSRAAASRRCTAGASARGRSRCRARVYYRGGGGVVPQDPFAYWGERAKFDYVLDAEVSVSDLISNEMLASVNGYRTMSGGRLHVMIRGRACGRSGTSPSAAEGRAARPGVPRPRQRQPRACSSRTCATTTARTSPRPTTSSTRTCASAAACRSRRSASTASPASARRIGSPSTCSTPRPPRGGRSSSRRTSSGWS